MAKRNYINPLVVRATMAVLEDFRQTHPESKTPMADMFRQFNEPESERQRYVRAAKRLGWNIVKTRGHIYENGFFVW